MSNIFMFNSRSKIVWFENGCPWSRFQVTPRWCSQKFVQLRFGGVSQSANQTAEPSPSPASQRASQPATLPGSQPAQPNPAHARKASPVSLKVGEPGSLTFNELYGGGKIRQMWGSRAAPFDETGSVLLGWTGLDWPGGWAEGWHWVGWVWARLGIRRITSSTQTYPKVCDETVGDGTPKLLFFRSQWRKNVTLPSLYWHLFL